MVRAAGWLQPPSHGAPRVTLNGAPFESVVGQQRADVADHVWRRERAGEGGFVASSRVDGHGAFRTDYLRISYENAPTSPHAGLARDFFLLDPASELPLPSEAQRARVVGSVSELGFRMSGATDFKRLCSALDVV